MTIKAQTQLLSQHNYRLAPLPTTRSHTVPCLRLRARSRLGRGSAAPAAPPLPSPVRPGPARPSPPAAPPSRVRRAGEAAPPFRVRARRLQRSSQPGSAPRPSPASPSSHTLGLAERAGAGRRSLSFLFSPSPSLCRDVDVLGPASPLRGLPPPLHAPGPPPFPAPAARTHSAAATTLAPGWRGVSRLGPARHLPRGRRAGTVAPPASLRRPRPARPGSAPRRAYGLSRKPFKREMHYIWSDAISEYSELEGTQKDRCLQLLALPRPGPSVTPCT